MAGTRRRDGASGVPPAAPLSRGTTRTVIQVAEVARGLVRPHTPSSCLKGASRTVSERTGCCRGIGIGGLRLPPIEHTPRRFGRRRVLGNLDVASRRFGLEHLDNGPPGADPGGTLVSAATTNTVPRTAATSQNADGRPLRPLAATLNRPMPSGTPRMAPGNADMTCAVARPARICCGVAPRASVTAEARLASRTVAQAVKFAVRAARVTSKIVITVSVCSSRLMTGLPSPPEVPKPENFLSTSAWKASTATMPMTVTAMLAALRMARRGLRATRRSPRVSVRRPRDASSRSY